MNIGAGELLVMVAMVAVSILVIFGIGWLVLASRRRPTPESIAILDDRLARGEISPADYDERRTRLR